MEVVSLGHVLLGANQSLCSFVSQFVKMPTRPLGCILAHFPACLPSALITKGVKNKHHQMKQKYQPVQGRVDSCQTSKILQVNTSVKKEDFLSTQGVLVLSKRDGESIYDRCTPS